jgi:peptidylprolyl isomerase
MTKRLSSVPLLALVAVGVSACGSSSPGTKIVLAPSQGLTAQSVTPAPTTPTTTTPTTPTTPTATTPAVVTPTSGPLSKQPTIKLPKGAPPKTLKTIDLIKGTGAVAGPSSSVVVNYVGELYSNGKVFDASWSRHQTFPAQLGPAGTVIKGWLQGIPGMRVGGRRELIIPPSLGYGAAGSPPAIPPNATLVFVVDLLHAA